MTGQVVITGQVLGAERLQTKLYDLGGLVRSRLSAAIQRSALEVLRDVKGDTLSGGALNVRTGRLRRSINHKFEDQGDALVSSVGTNVVYGRFWELGYQGPVKVRAHTRKVESRSSYSIKTKKVAAQGVAFVKAHVRNVNIQPRPFLTPVLEGKRSTIRGRLAAAILGKD